MIFAPSSDSLECSEGPQPLFIWVLADILISSHIYLKVLEGFVSTCLYKSTSFKVDGQPSRWSWCPKWVVINNSNIKSILERVYSGWLSGCFVMIISWLPRWSQWLVCMSCQPVYLGQLIMYWCGVTPTKNWRRGGRSLLQIQNKLTIALDLESTKIESFRSDRG